MQGKLWEKVFRVGWSVVRGVLTWKHAGKVVGKSLQSGMVCGEGCIDMETFRESCGQKTVVSHQDGISSGNHCMMVAFARLPGFGENVRPFISCLHFCFIFFIFFKV